MNSGLSSKLFFISFTLIGSSSAADKVTKSLTPEKCQLQKSLALQGNVAANYWYGDCVLNGIGENQSVARALFFFRRASALGDKLAIQKLESATTDLPQDNEGKFWHFVTNGFSEEIKLLVSKSKFDPNVIVKSQGDNAFGMAAMAFQFQVISTLKDLGVQPNHQNNLGCNALCWSVQNEDFLTTQALMKAGVFPDTPNHQGITPILIAAQSGNVSIFKEIMKGSRKLKLDLGLKENGFTPLMAASQGGFVDIVKLLVEKGASVDLKAANGASAIDFAENFKHESVKKFLEGAKKK